MKIIKSLIFIIFAIFLLYLILLLYNGCEQHRREREFLDKYEYEDFSQFNNVHIFIRGGDRESIDIMLNAPYFIKDTSRIGLYIVTLNRKSHQIIEGKWTLAEHHVEADTLKLQQLAQTFMKYKIPGLYVDTAGNVFVYIKDFETMAFVRFANENERLKRSKEYTWKKIKNTDNWYK
ncbi:MAG TPA: hypothetical protein PLQ91_01980 [Bacteroidales bacterium]|nr:hypothetical protein [Bacteroidales bacterium]HXK91669.1 hypothetical protein [Bacteroidales bacterium]